MWRHICDCWSSASRGSLCKPPLVDLPLSLLVAAINGHKISFWRGRVISTDWITLFYSIYLDENMSIEHKAAFTTTGVSVVLVEIPLAELSQTYVGLMAAWEPGGLDPLLCPTTRQLLVWQDFAQCQALCQHPCCIRGALLSQHKCLRSWLSCPQYRPGRRHHGQAGGCPLHAPAMGHWAAEQCKVFLSKTKAPASSPNQVFGEISKTGWPHGWCCLHWSAVQRLPASEMAFFSLRALGCFFFQKWVSSNFEAM